MEVLLSTKFCPPVLRAGLITRPRLVSQLAQGLRGKLTLLSAPAGFGKTTLLGEWKASAEGSKVPLAWVSLDHGDNDPSRFWCYISGAIQTLWPKIKTLTKIQELLETNLAVPPLESALTTLINTISERLSTDFVLVLDDYHLIDNASIHSSLTFLIDHLPPSMHLVIASRTDPALLPLARWRVRGELTELRSADLRFNLQEITAFLNHIAQVELSDETVIQLSNRTEGWVTALQLLAISLKGQPDIPAFIKSFTGTNRYLVDYLLEEVLNQLDETTCNFLLETAILNRLCGPLCDALSLQSGESGSSQTMLEKLEQANLFLIPLDQQRCWYRYHHLFADLLRHRLGLLKPQNIAQLHCRAARWYEQNSLLLEATEHWLAGEDYEEAARLLEQLASTIWMRGELNTLRDWLKILPDKVKETRPLLLVYEAWVLFLLDYQPESELRLNQAQQRFSGRAEGKGDLPLPLPEPEVQGILAAIQAAMACVGQDVEATYKYATLARQALPQNELSWRGVTALATGIAHFLEGEVREACREFLLAESLSREAGNFFMSLLSFYHLVKAQLVRGQLNKAVQLHQELIQLVARQGLQHMPTLGHAYIGIGRLLYEQNELVGANRYLEEGIAQLRHCGTLRVLLDGYLTLALVKQALREKAQALELIQRAEQLEQEHHLEHKLLPVAVFKARLWLDNGELDRAERWVEESGLNIDVSHLPPSEEQAYLILAYLLVTKGKYNEALHLLERLRVAAEQAGRVGSVIEIWLLQALVYYAQNQLALALAVLEHALVLAEPQGYIQIFANKGTRLLGLLKEARRRQQFSALSNVSPAFLDRLLAAFPGLGNEQMSQRPVAAVQTKTNLPLEAKAVPSSVPAFLPTKLTNQAENLTVETISEREQEVLRLVALGLSGVEIAQELIISEGTVKKHLKNIYGKLNAHNRVQAITVAKELGLL